MREIQAAHPLILVCGPRFVIHFVQTAGGRMQVARSDMSDLEWEFIKAVLPNKTRGKKRVDDRRVINGIFYVLRTGIPWADLPSEYGPPTTVYNRFNRWSYAGHWDRIMDAIADAHNVDTVMVDGDQRARASFRHDSQKKT